MGHTSTIIVEKNITLPGEFSDLRVMKMPNRQEFVAALDKYKELRGLKMENGIWYIWPSIDAVHYEVFKALGLGEKEEYSHIGQLHFNKCSPDDGKINVFKYSGGYFKVLGTKLLDTIKYDPWFKRMIGSNA